MAGRTQAGPAPWLADFSLVEYPEPGYAARTSSNVRDSDGTVWFGKIDCERFVTTHDVAVLRSLCATCKNLGIYPRAYLRDVLDRISTHPARWIEELLPDRWKALRQAGVATID